MSTFASPSAVVNPTAGAVALEIARMLEAEGPYRVENVFIADIDRAARQRRLVAERTVAATARRAAWLARNPVCVWCSARIPSGMTTTLIAGATLGACCVADYERTVFGAPLDETDVAVVECETRIADAFDHGLTCGMSVGEQAGERAATLRAA